MMKQKFHQFLFVIMLHKDKDAFLSHLSLSFFCNVTRLDTDYAGHEPRCALWLDAKESALCLKVLIFKLVGWLLRKTLILIRLISCALRSDNLSPSHFASQRSC